MKGIYNLAIHSGHNASAAIMLDGEIISAIQEERFTRKKNFIGFPLQSVKFCLDTAGITGKELARVAYTTKEDIGLLTKAQISTQFSLEDYHDYYGERFYGRLKKGESVTDYYRWLRDDPKFNQADHFIDFSYLNDDNVLEKLDLESHLFRIEQVKALSKLLDVSQEKIEHIDHHTCHAYYAYFGSPFRDQDCIAITLDGWGDGRNQTTWKIKDNNFTLLAESGQNDLGRVYKMATLILGMRPDEHEFKVMGLAPYAKDEHVKKAFRILEKISKIDNMKIVENERPKDLYSYLKEAWQTHRFDNIAGSVQYWVEEIAKQLVTDIYNRTGIQRYVLSGGVSMNIKMNKVIGELDCVSDLFICGSGGDESLSIGGCYYLNSKNQNNKPLLNLYLGYDIQSDFNNLDLKNIETKYKIEKSVSLKKVAELLVNGDIVGVVRGKCEFGARALGNRSILANPGNRDIIIKINEAIKNRDFWMPFALSILEEKHLQYIENPKNFLSPFMSVAFDTKPGVYKKIEAGTHPYDRTVRPQFVKKDEAPFYHELISEFENLTGIPALLNTSFNLHGEPIVNTIDDAVRTFELSGLDHLLIQDRILLSKMK